MGANVMERALELFVDAGAKTGTFPMVVTTGASVEVATAWQPLSTKTLLTSRNKVTDFF